MRVRIEYLLRSAAAIALAVAASAATAEQVTLESQKGGLKITGDLLAFDGQVYKIRTNLGDLELASVDITCSGPGCPKPELSGETVSIVGSDTVGLGLMPLLLEGFAPDPSR